jgi:hypothetical protein
MLISKMQTEEAKARILAQYSRIVATFEGEEAWKNILELRYQPGAPRSRVKRLFRDYTKSESLLVVFLVGEVPDIGIHFYLNSLDTGTADDEGDDNMFQTIPYTILDFPRCPKWLKRVFQAP